MSDEHGWADLPDDPGHHGFDHDHPGDQDSGVHAEPDPGEVWHDDDGLSVPEPYEPAWEQDPDPQPVVEPQLEHPVVDVTDGHAMGPVGADPDAAADPGPGDGGGADPVFPPALQVGELPEPVDGFPWIDTASLGVADPLAAPAEPVSAAELAGYAAEELPPAQDPWAHLEQSQDPATSALARWWRDNG